MWETSGWIADIDPYGWFQWQVFFFRCSFLIFGHRSFFFSSGCTNLFHTRYCRFYLGRRSSDDSRQIKRANGVCGIKGRFRNQLIGKCARGGTTFDDVRISPVIRQALQHWGYVLTKRDADKYVKLKGLPKLKQGVVCFASGVVSCSKCSGRVVV